MQKLKASNHKDVTGGDTDVLGGAGQKLPTDIYDFTIKAAYMIESANGALGLSLRLEADNGQEVRFDGAMGSIYMTNRNQEPFYLDSRTKEKKFLPGFILANSLSLLTVGEEIGDLEPEEKVINIYSPEDNKEVPTAVPMFMELVGQKFYGAVELQVHDKTEKDNKGDYVPTGETFEKNELVKVFRHSDRLTRAEIESEEEIADEDTFFARWKEKNEGKVVNKAKGTDGKKGAPKGKVGSSSVGSSDSGAQKKNSLFK